MKAAIASRTTIVCAIATAAVLFAGCEKQTTTTTTGNSTTTTTTYKPAPAVGQAVDKATAITADAAITAKVKTALLADPEVKGMQINVDTRDGIVMLSGALDKAGNIERAVTLARGVEGVKSVDNKLTAK
ncbi:MAG TPA: BON domain-containing protein [Casimicrobiaceae bacterium]|nr:BON domain-containing protein [Casimicrobiaceae bacterium]